MAARRKLPAGKLPPEILRALLARCPAPKGSGVVVGPRFGEDAAVIDIGSQFLVAKSDPITFATERIGWYAVHVNANDVACLGARPRWFLAALLLPDRAGNSALARGIFRDILRACRTLGVTLCGGHTEITLGLRRPVVAGQMLGVAEKPGLIRKQNQRPGDLILLTKGVALEGTAILAREKAAFLTRRLGPAVVRRAARLLNNPGISVLPDARILIRQGGVRALHDPTEGGVLAGLDELARAGKVGARIIQESIPVLPQTRAFAEALGFDPLALIASGALLAVVSRDKAALSLRALRRGGISAAVIGEVRPRREGVRLVAGGKHRALRVPERDEIARLL